MKKAILSGAVILGLVSSLSMAQKMESMDHSMMQMDVPAVATNSTEAYQIANRKMHQDMTINFSGNADVDFVRGMIPHHQGAIDMARIELKYGKDPEIRKLAQEVIKAQEQEIAFMQKWLQKNAKK